MAVLQKGNSIYPFWGENINLITGLDPLGLQVTSEATYATMLPGLSNLTNRLRYYGFYCWLIDFYFKKENKGNQTEQYRFIRRAELLIALLMQKERKGITQITGSDFASNLINNGTSNTFDLAAGADKDSGNEKTYWKYPSGAFGQYYFGAMSALSLVVRYENDEGDKNTFPNAKINVIIDESGTIPTELPDNKKYVFHDWKELDLCRNIGAKQQSKLHAKILHFKTKSNKEFCLFGSANITSAGLGISNTANSEVSLFIQSEKGNILDKIGLKLNGNSKKSLSNFAVNDKVSIEQAILKNHRFPIKLLAAEINYATLTLYTEKGFDTFVSVGLYDNNNQLIKSQTIQSLKPQHEINLDIDESELRYVQLHSTDSNKTLSNKIIVSNYFTIAKTHPNPKNAELERLCGQLQSGELRNVLDLIHFAIIDESEKEDGTSVISTSKNKLNTKEEKATADQSQLYDLSGYKPIEPNSQLHENALLLSPSLRVLDALKLAHTQSLDLEADIRMDEQEEDISNISGNEETEVRKEKSVPLKLLEADKRKLKNFFKNLYGYFHHDILFKDTKVSDYKLTLTDITKYLIALELIHEFGGKSEKIEDEQQQLFFTYLPIIGEYENDNVKGCCLNIVGDFLRLSKNGFKEYTFDYTRKKFEQLQRDALISTIVCIANIYWKEDERPYLKTLLLNTLHYLGWTSTTDIDKNLNTLIEQVKEKAKNLKQATRNLDTQLDYFAYQVCNAFRRSTQNRENGRFADRADKGQIIYSSIAGVGYCCVVSTTRQNEYCLARPGFNWNDQENEFINHFGDKIYRPLPLPRMTIVDL